MKFAEFHIGQRFTLGPVSLTEEEIVTFARAWDPQWFHTDPVRAAEGRWGGLIASGWQTCAIAMRLCCDGPLKDSESFGSPGLGYVKWPNPVRPDTPLTLDIEVLDVRRAASRPTLGIVRWRWRLSTAAGIETLDLEATSLFDLSTVAREG